MPWSRISGGFESPKVVVGKYPGVLCRSPVCSNYRQLSSPYKDFLAYWFCKYETWFIVLNRNISSGTPLQGERLGN